MSKNKGEQNGDPSDISLDSVKFARAELIAGAPVNDGVRQSVRKLGKPLVNAFDDISKVRNRSDRHLHFYVEGDTAVQDFYYKYDRGLVSADSNTYNRLASH